MFILTYDKRTNEPVEIWLTVQTCQEANAILIFWPQNKYYFNFYEFLKLSHMRYLAEKISLGFL